MKKYEEIISKIDKSLDELEEQKRQLEELKNASIFNI